MKTSIIALATLIFSTTALAETEHYLRRDGNHVQHLKISHVEDEIFVTADVDFDANENEAGKKHCSGAITGEAKKTGENEITFRKHIEGEARHCTLKIQLSPEGARVEQSPECGYYVAGICHFDSDGKELTRIK